MKSIVKVGSALAAITLILSGCSKDQNPTPEQTVLGSPTSPGSRPDWIGDGSNTYNAGLDGTGGGDGDFSAELPGRDGEGLAGDEAVVDVIYFGYDEYSIRPSERIKLEQVADILRSNPGNRLVAEGNTDWYGTTEYNLGLADRRANAVKTYLEQLGISGDRIDILSLGELEADQDLPKDSPAVIDDRRVDLILIEG